MDGKIGDSFDEVDLNRILRAVETEIKATPWNLLDKMDWQELHAVMTLRRRILGMLDDGGGERIGTDHL